MGEPAAVFIGDNGRAIGFEIEVVAAWLGGEAHVQPHVLVGFKVPGPNRSAFELEIDSARQEGNQVAIQVEAAGKRYSR